MTEARRPLVTIAVADVGVSWTVIGACRNFTLGEIRALGTGGMAERRASIVQPPAVRLGAKVRARRRDCGLTLVEVAERTGLSIGFLSQVERDITAPSLSSLALIAAALGVRINDFIREPPPVAVHHGGEEPQLFAIDPSRITYERLSTAFAGHRLNAIRMHVPPGYRSEMTSHAGEEFVFVLSGAIRYLLAERSHDLAAGDSLHFSAGRPHKVENHGRQAAEVLTVVTQDLFGVRAVSAKRATRAKPKLNGSLESTVHREMSK
jgi:transcriptional regulator with XRE-family HTH domain